MFYSYVFRCGLLFVLVMAAAAPSLAQPASGGGQSWETKPGFDTAALNKLVIYPELARRKKISGTVIVDVTVNSQGKVDGTAIVQGVHPLLDTAAAEAVRKYRFTPARQGDKPVKGSIRLPLVYGLNPIWSGIAAPAGEVLPSPDERIDVDVEPKYAMKDLQRNLFYPEEARRNNIEGMVMVRALVSKNGTVVSTLIDRCDHPSLCDAARNAVIALKMQPAMQKGEPIAVWIQIPIVFRLQ